MWPIAAVDPLSLSEAMDKPAAGTAPSPSHEQQENREE